MLAAPIGLLGGTFDPIHLGHLAPAIAAMQCLDLAQVRLLPNHIPPHRATPCCTPAQRLAMVQLAAASQPNFVVDERELKRTTPSYTIDTLMELRQALPDTPLCFLMGMDSLQSLPSWHRWRELLDYAHLVVNVRPGWEGPLCDEVATLVRRYRCQDKAQLKNQRAGYIWLAENLPYPLSASELRAQLSQGIDVRPWLPAPVADYIEQHGLYRHRPSSATMDGQ